MTRKAPQHCPLFQPQDIDASPTQPHAGRIPRFTLTATKPSHTQPGLIQQEIILPKSSAERPSHLDGVISVLTCSTITWFLISWHFSKNIWSITEPRRNHPPAGRRTYLGNGRWYDNKGLTGTFSERQNGNPCASGIIASSEPRISWSSH